jgi:hypothetical protein
MNLIRATAIGGYHTLAKLAGYSVVRLAEKPFTETVGAAISKIPGYSKIAEKAATAGESGENAKTLSKFYTTYFTDGMKQAANVWKRWRAGSPAATDVQLAFGKSHPQPVRWYDFFGMTHTMEKAPLHTSAFAMSLEKRVASAIKNGVDVRDPMVIAAMKRDAALYADREILQQNNRFANAVNLLEKQAIEGTKGQKPSGWQTSIALLMRAIVTKGVIRTPANYVMATLERSPLGLATGLYRAANALTQSAMERGGVKIMGREVQDAVGNMKPEEAAGIHRLLKVGAVGTAAFVWGMLDALRPPDKRVFGGYYQPGDKRNDKDAPWGSIRIGGHSFRLLSHNPLTEQGQMGSTMMRAAMSYKDKAAQSLDEKRGYVFGAIRALIGIAERAPIAGGGLRLSRMADPRQQENVEGEILRGMIPQILQNVAEDFDKKPWLFGELQYRRARGIEESVELGIPGLRQNVPIKKDAAPKNRKRKSLRERATE